MLLLEVTLGDATGYAHGRDVEIKVHLFGGCYRVRVSVERSLENADFQINILDYGSSTYCT